MEIAHRLIAGVDRMIQGRTISQIIKVSLPTAFSPVQSSRKGAFAALGDFRARVSESKELSAKPFTVRRRSAQVYQMTFYAISALLLFLSLFVFLSSPNWFYAMYMGHSWLIKALVGSFGVSLAGASAAVAFHLRPETEAVIHLAARTRRRLRQIYWLKATALTRQSVNDSNDTSVRLVHLKAAYQDAKAQIFDIKDENSILLRQISRATFVDPTGKEELFNQALNELDVQLQKIVSTFRDHHE